MQNFWVKNMAKGKITKAVRVLAESTKNQKQAKQTDAYRINLIKLLRDMKKKKK